MYPILHNGFATFAPIAAAAAPVDGEATGSIGGLLFYISIALGLSFLCSVLEAVLLSSSQSHIEVKVSEGSRAGRVMQRHKANVETPISAILTLNTIAHTVGAAGAGAEAVGVFGSEFFGIISAVLTFLILVFSEIIPKTIGATYWKPLMPFSAYTIQLLIFLLYPAVWFLRQTTRLFRDDENAPTITRVELEMMANISREEGALAENENKVLRNLLHLNKVHVYDVMTPRTVVFALQKDMTVSDVLQDHDLLPYSRIPIYDEDLDDVVGFVLRHEIFSKAANDEMNVTLRELKRTMHPIPETLTVATVLDEFIARQEHMFLVFDEYGGTAGIITMEDAVESLLGTEITDESDLVADMRAFAQARYKRRLDMLRTGLNATTATVLAKQSNGDSSGTTQPATTANEDEPLTGTDA